MRILNLVGEKNKEKGEKVVEVFVHDFYSKEYKRKQRHRQKLLPSSWMK